MTAQRPTRPRDDALPAEDQAAEQAVLGAMMLARTAITDATGVLTERDFYRPAHADIFRCIVELEDAGEPADAVTVGNELKRRDALDRVGGAPYLHTLLAAVPTAASAPYYAEIVADQAHRRRAAMALTRAQQLVRDCDPDQLREVLDQVRDELGAASVPAGPSRTTWTQVDLTDVLAGTYRPAVPTVGARTDDVGLFYPGRIHSLSGESESGKSWLALLACRTELDRGQAVLYLDFEDDEGGVVGRLLDLGADPASIRERFAYVRPDEAITAGRNRDALADVLDRLRPTLAVLDGVTEAMTLHGLELIDNADVARFASMLPRWISDRGPAVVQLDHVTKDRDGRGRYSIGGQHKLAGLNGAAYVMENRDPFGVGRTGRTGVHIAKDRPAQLRQHSQRGAHGLHWFADLVVESVLVDGRAVVDVTLVPPDDSVRPEAFRPTALMARVSDAMAKADRPLSGKEIEDRVRSKRDYVRAALAVLIDEKYVEKDTTGRAHLHTLVTPFDEAEQ